MYLSFIKTTVMMIGEFDFGDTFLQLEDEDPDAPPDAVHGKKVAPPGGVVRRDRVAPSLPLCSSRFAPQTRMRTVCSCVRFKTPSRARFCIGFNGEPRALSVKSNLPYLTCCHVSHG